MVLEQAANQAIAVPPIQPQTQVSEISDIEPMLDELLDTLLAAKLAGIEERLGKLSASAMATMNRSGKS